jgi:hypothetical protein
MLLRDDIGEYVFCRACRCYLKIARAAGNAGQHIRTISHLEATKQAPVEATTYQDRIVAVIQLIVEQGVPFSIVMADAIKTLIAGPHALTRENAVDIIEDIFARVVLDLKGVLQMSQYVSFTIDIWMARGGWRALGVKATYYAGDGVAGARVTNLGYYEHPRERAVDIASDLQDLVADFGVSPMAFCSDSALVMCSSVTKYNEARERLSEPPAKQVVCANHGFNWYKRRWTRIRLSMATGMT